MSRRRRKPAPKPASKAASKRPSKPAPSQRKSSMRPSLDLDLSALSRRPSRPADFLPPIDAPLPPPPAVPAVSFPPEHEPTSFAPDLALSHDGDLALEPEAAIALTPAPLPVFEREPTLPSGFFEQQPWENSSPELEGDPEVELGLAPSPEKLARRARLARFGKWALAACAAAAAVAFFLTRHPSAEKAAARSTPTFAAGALATLPGNAPRSVVATDDWTDVESAKQAAIAALEVHRDDEATRAARRATELDPADGEAWLILGAVHQDVGRMAEAFECYRLCTVKGRVDPKGECAAMLRSR